MGKTVCQEGQVALKEAGDTEPGQRNVNILPMELVRPVFQTSNSSRNYKHPFYPQVPQIQGYQRLVKMWPNNSSTEVKNFSLQMSNVINDNYQNKFAVPQCTMSNFTWPQFSGLQSFQDEITESRASSSQIPPSMPQIEKSHNSWKNMGKSCMQKIVPVQKVPHLIPDPTPERKRTTSVNSAYTIRKPRIANNICMQSYRDRVIHLLALKDYKKSELLIRLQKDDMKVCDTISLGNILLQVANLNATTLSYTLKDYIFKEIQRDWPGYNEEDKQSLDLVLSRKLGQFHNSTENTHCTKSPVVASTDNVPSGKHQVLHFAGIDTSRKNKVGPHHWKTAVTSASNGYMGLTNEKSVFIPSSAAISKYIPSSISKTHHPISNTPLLMKFNRHVYSAPEKPMTQYPFDSIGHDCRIFERNPIKPSPLEASTSMSIHTMYSKPVDMQHFIPEKFKWTLTKHKATIPNYNIDMMEKNKTDSTIQDEDSKPVTRNKMPKVCVDSKKTSSASGQSDSLNNYFPIVSCEQRQRYERDFRADYLEYHIIYEKIRNSCATIIDLDSERKIFPPGSKEYQDISKKISVEYQKMTEINPNFYADKDRCAFLYTKMAHIKKLINDFDQQHMHTKY